MPSVANRVMAYLRRRVRDDRDQSKEIAQILRTRRSVTRPPQRKPGPVCVPAPEDLGAILAGAGDDVSRLRDRAVLAAMVGAGVRRYEIPNMLAADYDAASGTLNVAGRRCGPLPEASRDLISRWIDRIREHTGNRWREAPLFPRLGGTRTGYGTPICDTTVNKILAKIWLDEGMPHVLHPTATRLAFLRDHPPAMPPARPFKHDPTPLSELLAPFEREPDPTWPEHTQRRFIRTRAVLQLMRSGVRMSQLLRLRVTDVDESRRWVQVTTLDHDPSYRRTVPLDEGAWTALGAWLTARTMPSEWLFPSLRGGRMSREGGRQLLRSALQFERSGRRGRRRRQHQVSE